MLIIYILFAILGTYGFHMALTGIDNSKFEPFMVGLTFVVFFALFSGIALLPNGYQRE